MLKYCLSCLILVGLICVRNLTAAEPATRPTSAAPPTQTAGAPFKNIDVVGFEKFRSDTNKVVLDVRTPSEFASGHVPGAVLLDVKGADFLEKAARLDKSKTYLVHCAAGVRSVKACNLLAPAGFTNLVNLEGGFNAWTKAGNKPVKL
ncbi:MAG: rhodanese-like domain-containing protein [Pedosphaera sp.]|nr:rhodanese-like domain-containing protein [Pedosphaera sp.]